MSVIDPATEHQRTPLPRAHARRLRTYYRSAGWPCHDNLEIDLLNAGLIERLHPDSPAGAEAIRVTNAGLRALGTSLDGNRRAFDAHEALVERVAKWEASAGRLVFRGLSLRGRVESGWKLCSPDVYSLRFSSVAAYTEPVIHEVKVRRADLLSDAENPSRRLEPAKAPGDLISVGARWRWDNRRSRPVITGSSPD